MIYAIAAVIVIIFDQLVKYLVTVNIPLNTGIVPVIPKVLSLVNIHNSGAAFGILQNGRILFIVIAFVFIVIVVYALAKGIIKAPFGRWAAVGVLAGAVGNCIDRIMNGYVVDMFKLEFMNYAIFNVADIFISCCGVLFCIYIIMGIDEEDGKEPAAEGARRARKRHDEPRRRPQVAEGEMGDVMTEETTRRMREDSPRRRPSPDEPRRRPEPQERQRLRPQSADAAAAAGARRRPPSENPEDRAARRNSAEAAGAGRRGQEVSDPFAEWDRVTQAENEKKRAERQRIGGMSGELTYPTAQKPAAPQPRPESPARREPPAVREAPARREPPVREEAPARREPPVRTEPETEPAPIAAAPITPVQAAPVAAAKAPPAPAATEEFSLDDILAEFK